MLHVHRKHMIRTTLLSRLETMLRRRVHRNLEQFVAKVQCIINQMMKWSRAYTGKHTLGRWYKYMLYKKAIPNVPRDPKRGLIGRYVVLPRTIRPRAQARAITIRITQHNLRVRGPGDIPDHLGHRLGKARAYNAVVPRLYHDKCEKKVKSYN